jgi:putative ABC transport system permease protein
MPLPLHQEIRLVRRELRSGLHGFGVFLSCLFLGVFAISAIGSFTASAKNGLLTDASAMLGGDLEIRLVHRELSREQLIFLQQRGEISRVLTLRTMAHASDSDQRTLVELKAIDQHYPLYGTLGIIPEQKIEQALGRSVHGHNALVEESLLARMEVKVGDQIRVGEAEFTISGALTTEPDRRIRAFSLGPRLMVSQAGLEATDLLQPGSLVTYAYRLRLPDKTSAGQLKTDLEQTFPNAGWRIRTWQQANPRVRFFLDRMNLNLTLIGLCALLLGGLGVSGAVRGYLNGKTLHIATMKCLGAPSRVIFNAYLLQVLLLGTLGSGAGLACGAAMPYMINRITDGRLPIPLTPGIYPSVLATAALFGLLIALVFSLKSLGGACRVSPSVLFRGYSASAPQDPGPKVWIAIASALSLLVGLVMLISTDQRLTIWFIFGAAACFLLFRLAAAVMIGLTRRLPRPANPSLRLGLGNIHRRGSPAASALFSLGLGLTALVIISLVQANLDDMVTETIPRDAPAFFFLDIQSHQVARFDEILQAVPKVEKIEHYPTLRGRITAIDDVQVANARISPDVQWAVRGDRYLSYAATPPPDTILTAGQWWPDDYSGPPLVSLTADIAKGFGIGIGDSITVNVLGREITAELASLRKVDWSTLDLNFAILFAPGVLENAPQTHIATVHIPTANAEAVFKAVTDEFHNVSAISTREVLSNVSRALIRIGAAFRGMAAVALLTGFLVLAGAVSADQHRRINDAVIFKVCGATRTDILKTYAVEFTLLGLTAGTISALVGSLAAFGILEGLMNTDFTFKPVTLLATLLTGVLLTMVLGLLGTWKALGQKPSVYLRNE